MTRPRALSLLVALSVFALPACGSIVNRPDARPMCFDDNRAVILLAQAVPDATWVPCVERLPAGWDWASQNIRSGSGVFVLSLGTAAASTVTVTLSSSCETDGMEPFNVSNTDASISGYRKLSTEAGITGDYRFAFTGGCITWTFALEPGTPEAILEEVDNALGFLFRPGLAHRLERDDDVRLCGAGSPPCEG